MEALRVELYQDHVCYRQETGYRFFQSYPLPTPSMVRGLVHRLMGAELGGHDYRPLKISIQGSYDSLFVDLQRWDAASKKRLGWKINNENDHQLMFWEELAEVKLILHLAFKNDPGREQLKKLKEAFSRNTVVLGRNEDLARIDALEIVSLVEPEGKRDKINIKNLIFSLKGDEEKLNTPVFRLPFAYQIVNGQRVFKYVEAFFIQKASSVNPDYYYLSGADREPVCFLELSDDEERSLGEK